jgi:hypothetical protein
MKMRRRCPQCNEIREFRHEKQHVCSTACEVARRKAIGWYARNGASARRRESQAPLALSDFGTLTERERGIYLRGRVNALTYAREKAKRLAAAHLVAMRVAS